MLCILQLHPGALEILVSVAYGSDLSFPIKRDKAVTLYRTLVAAPNSAHFRFRVARNGGGHPATHCTPRGATLAPGKRGRPR
jgi:hypothetical protein